MNIAKRLSSVSQLYPDAPAIIAPRSHRWRGRPPYDRAVSFAGLERAAAHGAAELERAGLKPGDRVLLLVPMGIELYAALVAIFRRGLVAVLLDPSAGLSHVAECCRIARPQGLLAAPRAHLLRLAVRPLNRIPIRRWVWRGWPGGRTGESWSGPADSDRPEDASSEAVPRRLEDPALLTFTSGSTGRPKAAIRTHGFLLAQHETLADAIDLQPGQVDLTTLPVFVLANLASGVTSVIPRANLKRPGFIDPRPVVRQIFRHGVDRSAASPAFFERIAELGRELPSLHRLYLGGAPVFPPLLDRVSELLRGRGRVAVVYGSTEAEPIGHQFWDEVGEEDRQRMAQGGGLLVGRAVPQVALRILPNSAGEPIEPMSRQAFEDRCLPRDRPGEVVVTGEHVLQGYLDGVGDEETKFRVHPEASFQAAESVKDLGGDSGRAEVWHRTGDAGYLDASDRLWLLGRASEVIRDGRGELHPFAVEAAVSHVVRPAALVALGEQRVLVLPKRQRHLEDHVWAALSWAEVDRIAYVKRIPMDRRHNAKVDYPALRKMLSR